MDRNRIWSGMCAIGPGLVVCLFAVPSSNGEESGKPASSEVNDHPEEEQSSEWEFLTREWILERYGLNEGPGTIEEQRDRTIDYLETGIRSYGFSGNHGLAHGRQNHVRALLLLKDPEFDTAMLPFLLGATVHDTRPGGEGRYVVVVWLGVDDSIPSFEVIGNGGEVVGVYEGNPGEPELTGPGPGTLYRAWFFRIVLPDDPADESAEDDDGEFAFPVIRVDTPSLHHIDGVRFVEADDAKHPRFVGVWMGKGVGEFAEKDEGKVPEEDEVNRPYGSYQSE